MFATDVLPLPIPNAAALTSEIDYFDKVGRMNKCKETKEGEHKSFQLKTKLLEDFSI